MDGEFCPGLKDIPIMGWDHSVISAGWEKKRTQNMQFEGLIEMAVALPEDLFERIKLVLYSTHRHDLIEEIDKKAISCHDCRFDHQHEGGLE